MKSILPGVFLVSRTVTVLLLVMSSPATPPCPRNVFCFQVLGGFVSPGNVQNEQFSSRHFYVSCGEFVHLHIKKEYKHFPHSETRKPGHTFFTKSPQTHHIFTTFQKQMISLLVSAILQIHTHFRNIMKTIINREYQFFIRCLGKPFCNRCFVRII